VSGLTDSKIKKLLGKRRKAELVEWIVEQIRGNDDLRRATLDLVASQADPKTLLSELRQMITKAWARTRSSREPWKLAGPISDDLAPVLSALEQIVDRGQAVEAEKVLRRFVEASDKGMAQVDDSYGYLGPMCQDAVTLWGKAWAKIESRDPAKLAALVFDGVQDDDYAIRDHMIRDFAPALGREGMLALKKRYQTQYDVRRTDKGCDDWKRREPLRHLADVADALGDVDLYIAVQHKSELVEVYAMPIARRLLDAGRAAESLEYLDRGDSTRSHFQGEKDDYTTLRCKILQALGRDDEAQDTLWQEFSHRLDPRTLDRLLAMTPEGKRQKLSDNAIATAEAHRDKLTAALFLMDQGQTDRAAGLIAAHPDAFDGRFYGMLLQLAEPLRDGHPAAAWVLYRALLQDILESGRSKAYHHAADYLAIMQDLAEQADLSDRQQELLEHLRSKHGRKYSFWNRISDG